MGFLLPDDADPVVTAATDVDTRNPITQLNHLVATLFTAGVSIDPSPLFEYRTAHALNADLTRSDAPSKQGLKIPLRIDWMPIYSPVVPPPSEPAPISSTVNIAPPEPTPAEPTPVASSLPLAPAAEVDARDALPFERNVLDRLPVLGRVLACEPGQSITIERVITLESDPYLIDHLFMHAPPKPITHRFPVVPLTMSLEFAAEAAFLLSPGEGLIGFENIRATRWIGLREVDSETLRIEAKLVGYDPETMVRRLDVKFYASDALSFSTIALFSTAYRNDLYLDIVDSSADGPWPIHASQIYSERYMFHGPAFQVLQELDTFGNPGASAKVEVFPKDKLFANIPDPILFTDPCLMDGIGQVVGIWALFFGSAMLPTSADRIEFYCPTPPVGTRAPIRMECLHFSDETRQIRAHVEIQDGQGNVWVRIENWAEWILNYSTEYIESTRMPQWFLSGQEMPLPGMPEGTVCVQLDREFIVGPDLEWVRRIFLHDSEMSVVTTLPNNKQKREVLASRIVAKDAARLWWALQHGVEYPYPCEFVINHDENGAPFLAPAGDPSLPHISIAHSDATYVALASNQPVGIDIEPESRDTSSYQDHFLTPEEASRANTLDSQMPEEVWALRFWCAKEALGKMLRIGLEGRPKQFEILDVSPTGLLSLRHRHTGTIYDVQTFRWNAMVYAYAVGGQPAASNPGVLLSHESSNS
jgi:phosphopantetheinyl transferase